MIAAFLENGVRKDKEVKLIRVEDTFVNHTEAEASENEQNSTQNEASQSVTDQQ